jgi:uncharacterized membrane protein YeaQ/YmgE (transglycosylase-associated protein family)
LPDTKALFSIGGLIAQTDLPTFRVGEVSGQHMSIIWTIIIGFLAGVIAKFVHSGAHEPQGFILTTILGIVGAFLATFLGQAIGWYKAGEGAGLIGAVVGAIVLLLVWGVVKKRA